MRNPRGARNKPSSRSEKPAGGFEFNVPFLRAFSGPVIGLKEIVIGAGCLFFVGAGLGVGYVLLIKFVENIGDKLTGWYRWMD